MNPSDPFTLRDLVPARHPLSALLPMAERMTGLRHLARLYRDLPPSADSHEFLRRVVSLFGLDIRGAGFEEIPRVGGAVLVANHPFGGMDGVVLAHQLLGLRPDVKVLTTRFLQRIPELAEMFIGVDNFGGPAECNAAPLREAVRWVRRGGLLVVFPAGEVAHYRARCRGVVELAWQPSVGRLLKLSGAAAIPVRFDGGNSRLFQAAGLLHPRLRTLLLAQEFIKKKGARIDLRVGRVVPPEYLAGLSPEAAIGYLRMANDALAEASTAPAVETARLEPVADPMPADALAKEVALLPAVSRLASQGGLVVYQAEARQIPLLMQEIGRLREITFRATGEGTGRSRDIDLYDSYYHHLFIWSEEKGDVVGAYRLGLADEIHRRFGRRGLYTHSLFRYRRRLLAEMGPSIELGRSFVRAEYQRSYLPLLLLWKGIGHFVAQHPRYPVLFGPVSISADYSTVSRELLVSFLRANCSDAGLTRHVRPRRPFRSTRRNLPAAFTDDPEQASALIARIERDNKGMPVLLRQYLKLGGRILGFNVDADFADALDGLIMVDLRHTDPKTLARYMGRPGADAFAAYHTAAERLAC